MSFFDDKLSLLLNHRMTWLNARANLMVGNMAHADIKGTVRREMKPFKKVLERHHAMPNKDGTQVKMLKIDAKDIVKTKTEVSRESEALEMSHNALEHDAIINTVKNFHQLVKTILNMSQAG